MKPAPANPKPNLFNQLPAVKKRHARRCHYCGDAVMYNAEECGNDDCKTPVKKDPPCPQRWTKCPTCLIGMVEYGDHYCRLCGHITREGFFWKTRKSDLDEEIKRMRLKFKKAEQAGASAVPNVAAAVAPVAVPAAAGAAPPAPVPMALHPIDAFQVDDEDLLLMDAA